MTTTSGPAARDWRSRRPAASMRRLHEDHLVPADRRRENMTRRTTAGLALTGHERAPARPVLNRSHSAARSEALCSVACRIVNSRFVASNGHIVTLYCMSSVGAVPRTQIDPDEVGFSIAVTHWSDGQRARGPESEAGQRTVHYAPATDCAADQRRPQNADASAVTDRAADPIRRGFSAGRRCGTARTAIASGR